DWFHDKTACTEKAIAAYRDALHDAGDNHETAPARGTGEGALADHLPTAYETALSRVASPAGQRTGPRPWILPGQPIDVYSDAELISLAQWIRSDDGLRTEDELLHEMMNELGFQRRGRNVVARLSAAIAWSAPRMHG